jgi:hypothetical protein
VGIAPVLPEREDGPAIPATHNTFERMLVSRLIKLRRRRTNNIGIPLAYQGHLDVCRRLLHGGAAFPYGTRRIPFQMPCRSAVPVKADISSIINI